MRYIIRINGEPLFEVDRLNQVPKIKIKNSIVQVEDRLTGVIWEREHCNSLSNFLDKLMWRSDDNYYPYYN